LLNREVGRVRGDLIAPNSHSLTLAARTCLMHAFSTAHAEVGLCARPERQGKRVLLIDDDRTFTSILRLNLPGYNVRAENNPLHALETARRFKPDLVFMDVIMPEMDGGTLAGQFKGDPTLGRVPIVFLTAIVPPQFKEFCGCECLAKPVPRVTILECLQRHLRARR